MTPRSLQTVLRTLVDGPPAGDDELLRRFLAGDGPAFGELVRRHARTVWSACRHLTRSEAEADDAFQATFLVLLTNARRVRDPAKLSAWLHGAAYKVCANARKAAARRLARERVAATPEAAGHAVPAAAWDRTLAAVHAAVPSLPEGQRVAFVLCCLDGLSPAEAARRLGVKPGTLDSRLSRAKSAVLARLDAAGVAGLVLVPAPAAVARAAALADAATVVPASLFTLSHGVVGMSVNPFKTLTAAALVACGVGGGVGSGWLAQAQTPAGPPAKVAPPGDEVRALRERLAATEAALAEARARSDETVQIGTLFSADSVAVTFLPLDQPSARTAKFDYLFVPVSGADQAKFGHTLREYEGRGWEFAGTTPLADPQRDVWVFRRPTAAPVKTVALPSLPPPTTDLFLLGGTLNLSPPGDEAAQLQAQIKQLQDRLAALKANAASKLLTVNFGPADSLLEPAALGRLLTDLGQKKFGTGGRLTVQVKDGQVRVTGDKSVAEWATALVRATGNR